MTCPHAVIARTYEHIEPIDRGERYEDRLQATLDARGSVFFAPDAEALFTRLERLRRLPIGRNASVVIRYGTATLDPRERRIPRR